MLVEQDEVQGDVGGGQRPSWPRKRNDPVVLDADAKPSVSRCAAGRSSSWIQGSGFYSSSSIDLGQGFLPCLPFLSVGSECCVGPLPAGSYFGGCGLVVLSDEVGVRGAELIHTPFKMTETFHAHPHSSGGLLAVHPHR